MLCKVYWQEGVCKHSVRWVLTDITIFLDLFFSPCCFIISQWLHVIYQFQEYEVLSMGERIEDCAGMETVFKNGMLHCNVTCYTKRC